MNITILSAGTRGDTQPFVALGQELQKSGHRVRLAAAATFGDLVSAAGLEHFPVRGDIEKIASGDLGKNARKAGNPLQFLTSLNDPKLKTLLLEVQEDLYAACVGAGLVVLHPGALLGYFYAREQGIPAVLASPFPMAATGEFPALLFYQGPHLGRAWNRLTHRLFASIMWMAAGSVVGEFWKKRFGRLPPDFVNPLKRVGTPGFPLVMACSPEVFPRPKDWSADIHMAGWWFLDRENDWEPPAELVAFLAAGTAPVYVGFGSVGEAASAAETTSLILEALHRSGQRGIIASGWSGLGSTQPLPDGVFCLKSAPHDWLFPRMAAVVHHGGAGTTAAGLRAGVPSVIIPHGNDQFAWGRRVAELGTGPQAIPRRSLTADRLANAIKQALEPEMCRRAATLGNRIRAEQGAAAAARSILEIIP